MFFLFNFGHFFLDLSFFGDVVIVLFCSFMTGITGMTTRMTATRTKRRVIGVGSVDKNDDQRYQ